MTDARFMPDKRLIKGTSLTGVGDAGNPSTGEVQEGRIVRIRPFDFAARFGGELEKSKWTIEARGRNRLMGLIGPYTVQVRNGYALPRCAEACPTGALRFGSEAELADDILGAEVLRPETGCRPRVYYRNRPGQFIAGLVYDPVEKDF